MQHAILLSLGVLAMAFAAPVIADDNSTANEGTTLEMHRYIIKRTFPAGALDGLNQEAKDKVNATNAKYDVKWLRSYANADKTTTFCVYEGPSQEAIREAAKANALPVDEIFEVPVDLMPNAEAASD